MSPSVESRDPDTLSACGPKTTVFVLAVGQALIVDGTLLASTNVADYPLVAPLASYGWSIDSNCFPYGVPEFVPGALNYQSIINSWNTSNITISGLGVVDGQGQTWWERCTRCHYEPPIGDWPHANASCLEAGRPMLLQFTFVDELSVSGESVGSPLTIQNSPFWTFRRDTDVLAAHPHPRPPHPRADERHWQHGRDRYLLLSGRHHHSGLYQKLR
eukprot:SAG11_NODE_337_length_10541_cov_14.862574_3_plen_216_part_00